MHRNTISPRLRIHAAVAASFAIATAAFANTWTNTLGGVFSDGGNWKEGAAPTSGVNADFSKAPGEYTVRFTGDAEAAAVTFTGDQDVTLDVGAGNTWTVDNSKLFTIGDTVDADTSLSIVSGCVTGVYKIILGNRIQKSVRLKVANQGTTFMSNRDDLDIGWNGGNATVEILSGATLRGGRGVFVGYNAAASNNTVTVSGAGSIFGNGPYTSSNNGIMIGYNAGNNSVLIEDGAVMTNVIGNIIVGNSATSADNSLVFDNGTVRGVASLTVGNSGDGNSARFLNGSTAAFPNGITVIGNSSCGNSLEISGGSYFLPGTHLYLGQNAPASNNTLRIAGAGTVVTNKNFDFNCGNNGSYNTWIVEDGAYVCPVRSFITGTTKTASHNTSVIRGTGTYLKTNAGNLDAGQRGTNNVVVITEGARADITGEIHVGYGKAGEPAPSNTLFVTDGAVVTNTSNLIVGTAYSPGNTLVVSNAQLYSKSAVSIGYQDQGCSLQVLAGGVLGTGHHFFFGNTAGASNATVRVAGEGSRIYNIYDIDIGYNAQDCRMDIEDGAYVYDNRDFYVGRNSTASNNLLRVSNASLNATYDNNRFLRVNYGGTLLVEGTNTAVNVSQLQFRGESTLAFTVGRGGYMAAPITTRRPTYEAGTKLVIDATEFAKAGGGWVDLMTYIAKTGTATGDMTLLPEGIQVEETDTSLRIKVPSFAGSIIFFK